jgi:hypothetical protein
MNVVDIPVKDENEAIISKMERDFEINARTHLVFSKYRKMQYDNFIAVGFSPEQALHLLASG